MLRSPTLASGRPNTSRAYTEPRCANPTSSLGSQSTLAPASSTSTGCLAVGNRAPMAGRCTPACRRSSRVAAAITAPVLPAEMNASDLPCFCRLSPTAMDELGLPRTAARGFSPIPTTSGASTMSSRLRSTPGTPRNAASTSLVRPTSWMRKVGGSSRSACAAPSTSTRGALSLPIASSAMRITSDVLDRDPLLVLVIATGRAHPVRPLHVPATGARLERGKLGLVVRATGPLLPLRCPSLGYGHADFLASSVAELVLERGQRLPARVHRVRRAAAGARVQVLATPRAEPAAILATLQVPRDREKQLFADSRREIHGRGVRCYRVGLGIIGGPGFLGEQGRHRHHDVRRNRDQTAAALSDQPGAQHRFPIKPPLPGRLQPPAHPHRVAGREFQAGERGVRRRQLAPSLDRPSGQLTQVHLQHGQRT